MKDSRDSKNHVCWCFILDACNLSPWYWRLYSNDFTRIVVSVHLVIDGVDFLTRNFDLVLLFLLVGCLIPSNCVPPLARALLTTDAQQEPILIM